MTCMVSYETVRSRIGATWIEQREKDAPSVSVIETSDLTEAANQTGRVTAEIFGILA